MFIYINKVRLRISKQILVEAFHCIKWSSNTTIFFRIIISPKTMATILVSFPPSFSSLFSSSERKLVTHNLEKLVFCFLFVKKIITMSDQNSIQCSNKKNHHTKTIIIFKFNEKLFVFSVLIKDITGILSPQQNWKWVKHNTSRNHSDNFDRSSVLAAKIFQSIKIYKSSNQNGTCKPPLIHRARDLKWDLNS